MAVKRIRKLSDDYESDDDILSAVYRPSKISCFEKDCYSNGGGYVNVESDDEDEDAASFLYTDDEAKYSRYNDDHEGEISCSENVDSDDEAAAYLVQEFLSFVDEFISCDKVHSVKEGCMDEKSSCYVNDEYSEDEAEYSRYWDEDYCTELLKEVVM
ncbi:hypothetical protein Tco_0740618 [Tanacetum coccineum]